MKHTSTEALRTRMREHLRASAVSTPASSDAAQLATDELEILSAVASAGGRHAFSGLDTSGMVDVVNAGFALQHRGLVRTTLRFAPGAPVRLEEVVVEITDVGRKAVGEEA